MSSLKSHLPEFLLRYRRLAVAVANLTVAAGAYTLATLLRFDFSIPQGYRRAFLIGMAASAVVHYAAFYVFKLTRGWWRSCWATCAMGSTPGCRPRRCASRRSCRRGCRT